ncbi:MAG TPA: HAD family phosphatase [Candidatus Saccharibacteria bacterium]|jgi:beta-phosphoglucomutase|nr:HAD family phosphatase [Candidatus Saccharibacteria bacterium]HMT55655.1 HAD family phosphatase [Candidatus Saccharibacteria bacterium]
MQNKTVDISRYKAAIFDMDGTMIRNMGHHKRAWQEFLRRHHVTLSDDEFQQKISGKKNDAIIELVFGRKMSKDELTKYADEKEAIYRELYKHDIEEVEGLTDFLLKLHKLGLKTAIATTAPLENRNFALNALGLNDKFEVILGDEHVSNGKPNPEIYINASRLLKVEPKDCIVFEDSPPGINSGKAAGMTVIALQTSHKMSDLLEADYFIHDFKDLI